MKVKRTSIMSGKVTTMDLDITVDQVIQWEKGALIQDIMGHLSPEHREFLISGITSEEWREKL
jgi:hypothetical protein